MKRFCDRSLRVAALFYCVAGWCLSAIAQERLWDPSVAVPSAGELREIDGIEFHVIKRHEPDVDHFDWLHGVALAWHDDRLFVSYGHNHGKENTASEVANYSISTDAGVNWSSPKLIDEGGEENLAVSHGVFLSDGGKLWAFHGAFYGRMKKIHTRAYSLNESTGDWTQHGVVVKQGFWPMQEPQRMPDGNWIMAGLQVVDGIGKANNPAAVAISHGDDLLKWDLVSIPKLPQLNLWGESTVIIRGFEHTEYRSLSPTSRVVVIKQRLRSNVDDDDGKQPSDGGFETVRRRTRRPARSI